MSIYSAGLRVNMKRFVSLSGIEATDDRPLVTTATNYGCGSIVTILPANPKRVYMLIEAVSASGIAGQECRIGLGQTLDTDILLPAVGASIQFDQDFPYYGELTLSDPQNSFHVSIVEMSLP